MKGEVVCFLPCRSGSERVRDKNVKPFAHYKFGLFEKKIATLLNVPEIDKLIVSTNDIIIIEYISNLNNEKISLDLRPEVLCSSNTKTDDLIKHAFRLIGSNDTLLWTHVTSPFLEREDYSNCILLFRANVDFDSLVTVTPRKSYFWMNGEPVNYNRDIERWPNTQKLFPLYEVNSGMFITEKKTFELTNDRIGLNPYFCEIDSIKGMDIDWPEDFLIAECLEKVRYEKFI